MKGKKIIIGLGSAAAALAIGGAVIVSGIGFTQHVDVSYMTDGPSFSDVTDLTKASGAVAHVRILSAGNSYTIEMDKASPVVDARPSGNPDKDGRRETSATQRIAPPSGILKTDYTVEVLDTVRGAGIKKGDHIVVSQLGGTLPVRTPDGAISKMIVANAEHDPVMQVGDEEMLFLNQDAGSGKFFTTGGGAGRFKVQSNGSLTAVDHGSQIARIVEGKPNGFLKNAVRAVN